MRARAIHGGRQIRRKLLAVCTAYLSGIYLAQLFALPDLLFIVFSALFLIAGVLRHIHRKSALSYLMAFMLLFGIWHAGSELSLRDVPTKTGTPITGTVSRIVSENRVYLKDAVVEDGRKLLRPAVVTLMMETDDEGNPIGDIPTVRVGQVVSGTGRLFEQEEVRNPGGVNRRISALCDGYELSGYILPGWCVQGESSFSLLEVFRQIRLWLLQKVSGLFGEQSALFQAVMLGERSQMDSELVQAMRLTGIAHLLTVSGMHLSLVAMGLEMLMSVLCLKRRVRLCVKAVFLGCFACLTGYAPGTIRAYIMSMVREVAVCSGRSYDSLTALGAAALAITFLQPLWALNASFQFSFFVVLGILLLSSQLTKLISPRESSPSVIRRLARMASVSVSAQAAALPVQLVYYGYIPLLALPMNLLCGLLMPLILYGGWFVLAVGLFAPGFGAYLGGLLGCVSAAVEALSLAASEHAWGILRLPAPHPVALLLAAGVMYALSRQVYIGRGRSMICLLLCAALSLSYSPKLHGGVVYSQLDVGQGDAAVIRNGRQAVLVDAGPEDAYDMLRFLRHEGLFVDAVVFSHLDEDHAGALGVLLESEIMIDRIVMAVGAEEEIGSPAVQEAMEFAKAKGVRIEEYEKGDTFNAAGFTFNVLSPDEMLRGSNERSLALYADVGGMRLLTLGDLPADKEMEEVPDCDLLKVAHHGSKYATSRTLIEAVTPRVALISVGRNSYGHPSNRVLEDLKEVGAQIYRTDESGCVTIKNKDGHLLVSPYIRK